MALCRKAERPVLLLGGGARNAAAQAQGLAARLDAPAVMTVNARGLLPPTHPLAVPASPSVQAVRDLVADADLVLAFDDNDHGFATIDCAGIHIAALMDLVAAP